jgi:hypothetical protein
MSTSSSLNYIFVSLFLALAALKIKDRCYYCFLGLLVLGIIFLIFGIVKFVKQRNG